MKHNPLRKAFDFIVVGAGSAGCVVANRLSANPSARVLVLEAGSPNSTFLNKIPLLSLTVNVALSKRVNWAFHTEPEPALKGRRIYQPRGKLVGGSSAINGMINVRGHPSDYDNWASEVGCSSWSWPSMLRFFRKSQNQENSHLQEAVDTVVGEKLHGSDGPLHCSDPRFVHPLSEAMIAAACSALDLPSHPDFAAQASPGFGAWQLNQHNGQRWDAGSGYLTPDVLERPNLHVECGVQVNKILLAGGRSDAQKAVGVSIRDGNGEEWNVDAGEVILASGVFGSPQLLMLSGIGPRDELSRHGISNTVHLPGVGGNLQDHLDVQVAHANPTRESFGLSAPALLDGRYLRAAWEYAASRTGMFASNCVDSGGYCHSRHAVEGSMLLLQAARAPGGGAAAGRAAEAAAAVAAAPPAAAAAGGEGGGRGRGGGGRAGGVPAVSTAAPPSSEPEPPAARAAVVPPDVQFHFFPGSFRDYSFGGFFGHDFSAHATQCRPLSRGRVRLRSAHPAAAPALRFNYLSHPHDVRVMREGVRLGRAIMGDPALDGVRGRELLPGGDVQSDAQVEAYVRSQCKSAHHPVGSCRMGRDPGAAGHMAAVVDGQLRVYGVGNLRVVDASIMPTITTSNTHASTIAIAEHAAEKILNG